MPAMKVTSSAAMRARDVSRPHDEHVAWAEETEAGAAGQAAASVAAAASMAGSRAEPEDAAAPERSAGRRGRPDGMRRRRRGGGGGRG
jgi:hypothetical protein